MAKSARVHVLGGLRVEGFGDHELGSRKGRQLLKVLALAEGRGVRSETLVEVLWGDRPPQRPADQIGVLVARLRRVLGADRIVRTDAGYALKADWIDLVELRDRLRESTDALSAGRLTAARAAATAAVALGGGELLPEDDGEWIEAPRGEAAALVAAARRVVVDAAAAAGDPAVVVVEAEAALAHDPYDEQLTAHLMRAQAALGRTGSALAVYARLRERLVEDLGVSPSDQLEELHTRVLLGEQEPVATRPAPDVPFVGRDDELSRLDVSLASASRGQTSLVSIEGEAGIGKTTLASEWLRRMDPTTHLILQARCDELGRDLPLQPIADAYVRAQRLATSSDQRIADADRTVLASALGIDVAGERPLNPDPQIGAVLLFGALLRAFEALAGDRMIVLWVDDLHLAGQSTLEWLAFAVRRATRLVVVVTRRPGLPPLPGSLTIDLGPLSLDAVASLVGPDRAEELHRHSGGNPLLMSALTSGDGHLSVTDVTEIAQRQAAALGHAADAVRTAAVLGRSVDLDLLAMVVGRSAVEVLGDLERTCQVGLLVDDGFTMTFRHELVREALANSLTAARRALVHREAARALHRRDGGDPAAVAHHARLGGERQLASLAYLDAARAAEMRYDLAAAESYADAAIELQDRPEARTARARIRMSLLRHEEAATDVAVAVRSGGGASALEVAAWIAYYRRRYPEAQSFADEAVAAAEDVALRTSALAVAGRVRHGRGDLLGALETLRRVSDDAPAPTRAVADVWHAHALLHAGDPHEALRRADHALAVGDRLAQPFAPLHGRFARIMALGQLGRPSDAQMAARELAEALGAFGTVGRRFGGPAANLLAWTHRLLGEHTSADEANQQALDNTGGHGGPASTSLEEAYWVAWLDLADGALMTGDVDRAGELLERLAGMASWQGTMAWHQRHRLGLIRARLALASDEPEAARQLATDVAADAEERGAGRYLAIARATVLASGASLESADAVLADLDRRAGSEAWRIVAEVARHRKNDALRHWAGDHATKLLRSLGEGQGQLAPWIDRVLSD